MPLSTFQRDRCTKIVDSLLSYTIAKMFAQPVDPVRDNVPNYFEIVKNPMDLGTIRKKLEGNIYNSVSEWRSDMDLVWANSFRVSSPKSILGLITTEMQNHYIRIAKNLTDDPQSDWNGQLGILRDEFNELTKKIKAPKDAIVPKQSATKAPKSSKPPQAATPAKKPPKKRGQFTKQDIIKLTSDINHLDDMVHIQTILDLLSRLEPSSMFDDDGKVEMDLMNMKQGTLYALRDKVDQLLSIA